MPPDHKDVSATNEFDADANDGMVLDRKALLVQHAESLAQIDASDATTDTKLAYFRACKGNILQATTRLRETLEWRRQSNIDAFMADSTWREKEQNCRRQLLHYDYLGTDKYGRPVLVELVGRWNVTSILTAAKNDPEAFLELHCMACETMLSMPRPTHSRDSRGQVIIMDCQGLSTWHCDPRLATVFGRLASHDAAHYPDTLAHIFVLNAPYLFTALSKLIAPFMDPDTYSKVHVSSAIPKELIQCVGADCLPTELGGNRKGIFPYHPEAPLSEHPS